MVRKKKQPTQGYLLQLFSSLVTTQDIRTLCNMIFNMLQLLRLCYRLCVEVLVLGIVGTGYVACEDERLTKDGNQKHLNTIVVSLVHYV